MNITCAKCQTTYQIADTKVPAGGARANCPNCGNQIIIPAKGGSGKSSNLLVKSESADYGQTISYDFQQVDQSNTEVSELLKQVSDADPFLTPGVTYVVKDTLTDESFPVTGPQVSVGRSGSDVNLGDPEVSRRHCILKIYGEDVVLIDMESTNGTFIQGKRVMTARLRKDEPFTVGNTTLVLTTAG
jgi:predicted Zn finger-like uncharacterized protein